MAYSIDGYKRDSKDVNKPSNLIPSGDITMKGVDFPVMGTDNLGNQQLMQPGLDYQFPGSEVFEQPMQDKPKNEVKKRRVDRDNRLISNWTSKMGDVSSHLMSTMQFTDDDGSPIYVAVPTLFPIIEGQETPDPSTWIQFENGDMKAFEMAMDRGEVYYFDSAEEAEEFSRGSWKTPNLKKRDGGQLPKAQFNNAEAEGEAENYMKNYLNSGLFKKRVDDVHGEENYNAVYKAKMDALNGVTMNPTSEEEWMDIINTPVTNFNIHSNWEKMNNLQASYKGKNNMITYNPGQSSEDMKHHNLSYNPLASTIVNEYAHALGAMNSDKYFPYPMTEKEKKLAQKRKKESNPNDHDVKEHEIKSDIETTRFELYNNGLYNINDKNFKFDKSHIDFMKANPDKFIKDVNLFDIYEDDVILDMMNTFTDNSSMPLDRAKFGGSLPKAQLQLVSKAANLLGKTNKYKNILPSPAVSTIPFQKMLTFNQRGLAIPQQHMVNTERGEFGLTEAIDDIYSGKPMWFAPLGDKRYLNNSGYSNHVLPEFVPGLGQPIIRELKDEIGNTGIKGYNQFPLSDYQKLKKINNGFWDKEQTQPILDDVKITTDGFQSKIQGIFAPDTKFKIFESDLSKGNHAMHHKWTDEELKVIKEEGYDAIQLVDQNGNQIENILINDSKFKISHINEMPVHIDNPPFRDGGSLPKAQFQQIKAGWNAIKAPFVNDLVQKSSKLYRGIGKAGYKDALNTGRIQSNQSPNIVTSGAFNLTKNFKDKTFFTPTLNTAIPYGGDYVAEINSDLYKFKNRYNSNWSQFTTDNVLLNKSNIYKKNILGNYKKILSQENSEFKSDINWGNFNKEILNNEKLLTEYNSIENKTKQRSTWMKNEDGTSFLGTPEQFIQQRSKNFNLNMPNVVRDNKGLIQTNYHGSPHKFDTFDEKMFNVGIYGKGIYTTPDLHAMQSYAKNRATRGYKDINPTQYELYINSKNPVTAEILDMLHSRKGAYDFMDNKQTPRWQTDPEKWDFLQVEDPGIRGYDEAVMPFSNFPKSMIGNNGMFDMKNPNINKKEGGSLTKHQVPKYIDGVLQTGKNITSAYNKIKNYIKPPINNSTINWAAVNPEILNNVNLLNEYANIEQATKANATWMKNDDGTSFWGTPAQFIQQKSQNFMNAYPNGFKKTFRGESGILKLSSPDYMGAPDLASGNSGIFTGTRDLAARYARNNTILSKNSVLELAIPRLTDGSKFLNINGLGSDWTDLSHSLGTAKETLAMNIKNLENNLRKQKEGFQWRNDADLAGYETEKHLQSFKDFYDNYDEIVNNPLYQSLVKYRKKINLANQSKYKSGLRAGLFSTDDVGDWLETSGLNNISLNYIDDGGFGNVLINQQVPGNYLKSLTNNNGMFDLNNPKILKQEGGPLDKAQWWNPKNAYGAAKSLFQAPIAKSKLLIPSRSYSSVAPKISSLKQQINKNYPGQTGFRAFFPEPDYGKIFEGMNTRVGTFIEPGTYGLNEPIKLMDGNTRFWLGEKTGKNWDSWYRDWQSKNQSMFPEIAEKNLILNREKQIWEPSLVPKPKVNPTWATEIPNFLPKNYLTDPLVKQSYIESGAYSAKNQSLLSDQIEYGSSLDKSGFDASTLIDQNISLLDAGLNSNRTVTQLAMPDGKNQFFMRSSGNAGKSFRNQGSSEGLWSPFPGFHTTLNGGRPVDNWFVKGTQNQYDNFYGSKSYEEISKKLSELEITNQWDMSNQGFKSLRTTANPNGLPSQAIPAELKIFRETPGNEGLNIGGGKIDNNLIDIRQQGGQPLTKAQLVGETKEDIDWTGTTQGEIINNEPNLDLLKQGVGYAESLNGELMINPESTATGLYGQRFSEVKKGKLYEGTRDEFAVDLDAQNSLFEQRYNGEIKDIPGLKQSGIDLYEEYNNQITEFPYSTTEIAALVNFLGRKGTRDYLGYVLRDGNTLESVFPTKYGSKANQANKTPNEYIIKFNEGLDIKKKGGEVDKLTERLIKKYEEGGTLTPAGTKHLKSLGMI